MLMAQWMDSNAQLSARVMEMFFLALFGESLFPTAAICFCFHFH